MWLALASLLVVVSCGGDPRVGADARVDLFAAAVARRVVVDNSFGGTEVFDRVQVIEVVGRVDGEDVVVSVDDPALTTGERNAIEQRLAPRAVTFVPATFEPAAGDGTDLVAVVRIGEPSGDDDEAVVTTGMYCGGTCGAGGAQRFAKSDGTWSFVEDVGGQWMT